MENISNTRMYDFGVMRRWLAIVFFVFLTPTSSFAGDAFTYAGVTLNYEQGTIDSKTLTGDASNVRITFLSGKKLLIDNYAVSIRSSGQKTYIDDINLSGITAIDNADTWNIENIRISDFILDTPNFHFNTLMGDRPLETIPLSYGAVVIKGLDISSNDHGRVKVDQFTLSSQNVDGANFLLNPLQTMQAKIKNFRFFPGRANKANFIDVLGVDKLNGDAFVTFEVDVKSDRVDSDLNIIMAFNDIGVIEFNLDLGIFNAGLKMLDKNFDATGKYEDDKALEVLTSGLFNSASISFTDYGILDQLIGVVAENEGISRDNLIDNIMAEIVATTAKIAPETYVKISGPIRIRNFLQQGGGLAMTMAPSSPIPLTTLVTYIVLLNDEESSDFAATSLGLSITHQPQ